MDKQWYLVQCKVRESFRAAGHLENQGYTVFHPTCLARKRRAGRVHTTLEPLFPYYLFIQLACDDNWAPLRSTRGVNTLVRFNGAPVPVEPEIIEGLRVQCARLHGEGPEPLYKPGDRVVITEGCFRECEAIVSNTKGEERVVLLLNLLNRPQSIEIPVAAIAHH